MTQIMTPSKSITAGQINKAVANYRALLEKHSRDLNSNAVQIVLSQSEFAGEQFAVFRRRVEAVSNLIVRKVKVNRARSPQEAIEATGRGQYTDRSVVDAMPKGEGDEVEVVFFKLNPTNRNDCISDNDLEKEYEFRGLKPADPYSVSAVNEIDPSFADENPNLTHWKDAKGDWCYAAFARWTGEREVDVICRDRDWHGLWWFAGLRK